MGPRMYETPAHPASTSPRTAAATDDHNHRGRATPDRVPCFAGQPVARNSESIAAGFRGRAEGDGGGPRTGWAPRGDWRAARWALSRSATSRADGSGRPGSWRAAWR